MPSARSIGHDARVKNEFFQESDFVERLSKPNLLRCLVKGSSPLHGLSLVLN